MPINENMVQEIVQEVMAKMQIADAPTGKHGIFKEMNDAIEAAKKSQLIVKKMSMDQREKIITCIRKKIKENAEVMARMGVEETGMGNVGDKILKHHLVADKTPGTEVITTTAWSGDRGLTLIEMGPFGVIGAITPCTNPSETILCNTMGMLAGGNTVEDMLQLIPELEKRGVDAFEISGGSQYELPNKIMPSHGEVCATNLEEALKIKEVSHVPVILVGKINDAKLARSLVEEEKVDGIVLGRALLADADFVKKVKEGKDCQIAPCTGCLVGCVGQQTKRLCGTCVINPFCGHEIEMKIEPSTSNKKIMVIGGGIGGLSAARMCALRGLNVEVFEKNNVIGGQINLASKIAPKKEMHKWIDYLESECQRLHIPVHLNHAVKVGDVKDFDVVLVCNGSIPKKPNENAYTAHDILGDKVDVHGNILVVGGGMVGVEASEYICEKHPDAHVTILEMKKNIDDGESPANLVSTMTRIQTLPITAITETKLVSVEDGVVVEKAGETQKLRKFDFIIYATGSKPDPSLYEAIRETGKETYLFGDASSVAQALEAVRDGVNIALKL